MRYRALSPTGDFTFGQGKANFLVDSPATVGQAILTRLRLWTGEWFLDLTEGTPWLTGILGRNGTGAADLAIQNRILGTPGVVSIVSYSSYLNPATRQFTVSGVVVQTQYGAITVTQGISLNIGGIAPLGEFVLGTNVLA